jgi:hypothetical protein
VRGREHGGALGWIPVELFSGAETSVGIVVILLCFFKLDFSEAFYLNFLTDFLKTCFWILLLGLDGKFKN